VKHIPRSELCWCGVVVVVGDDIGLSGRFLVK
jgi:hypothetical protein